MAKKHRTGMVLWPEYFDSNLTKDQGRRVGKDLSVPSPNSDDLHHVCRKLGLYPDNRKDKAFPSRWFDPRGCVIVEKKFSKSEIISMVAMKLVKRKT